MSTPLHGALRTRALELLEALEHGALDPADLRQATARWARELEAAEAGPGPGTAAQAELGRLHALLRAGASARLAGTAAALEHVRHARRSFREHVGRPPGTGEVCDVTG